MAIMRLPIFYILGQQRFKAGKALALLREFNTNFTNGYWDNDRHVKWPTNPQMLNIITDGTCRYIVLKNSDGQYVEVEYSARQRKIVRNFRPMPDGIDLDNSELQLMLGWADIDHEDSQLVLEDDRWDVMPTVNFISGEAKHVYLNYTNEKIVSCLEILPEIICSDGSLMIHEKTDIRVVCSESIEGIFIYGPKEIIAMKTIPLTGIVPRGATFLTKDDDFIYIAQPVRKEFASHNTGESDIGVDFIQGTLNKNTQEIHNEGIPQMTMHNAENFFTSTVVVGGNHYSVGIDSDIISAADSILIIKYAFEQLAREKDWISFTIYENAIWAAHNGDTPQHYQRLTMSHSKNTLVQDPSATGGPAETTGPRVVIEMVEKATAPEKHIYRPIENWIPSINQYVKVDGKRELFIIIDFDAVEDVFFLVEADKARRLRRTGRDTSYDLSGSIQCRVDDITPYSIPIRKQGF